jgi:seryl-tRNA synthetase
MIDIQLVRDNPDLVQEKSAQKGVQVAIDQLLQLDTERRSLLQNVEALRARRNEHAKGIQGKPSEEQIKEGVLIKSELAQAEEQLSSVEQNWQALLKKVPNMPADDVPVGASEDENVVIKTVGEPPTFDFEPKSHDVLGAERDWIDKERAAKISGSRFVYLKNDLVRLQLALMQWTMQTLADQHVVEQVIAERGLQLKPTAFMPVMPPMMMRTEAYEATGRLKAEEVTYKLADDDAWLIGSAEHSLCAMYQDEIIPAEQLPIRYLGYSTSFRREAGTYSKDINGLIRLHHFDKLEMEVFSDAETSRDEHELLIGLQEYLVSQLGLPYRLLNKCTADIGDPNARGVDLEVWVPSQNTYRETHSADYMTDFQARGLNTRYRTDNGETAYAHTNDATAFALGRTMAFVIENNQKADGRVRVPEVLRPLMGGVETI